MRGGRLSALERELRAGRPRPREGLVESIVAELRGARPAGGPLRLAFAGVLTGGMLVALASVGGIGYAANAAREAVEVVKKAVAPSGTETVIVVRGISSGGDQYRPGFGFGDPNHNHTGPPGLVRKGGPLAPPLIARRTRDGLAAVVSTRVTIDEQAHLSISVIAPDGKKLLLTQGSKRGGSKVGQGVSGPQTKVIQYALLVPRTFPVVLRIPIHLLQPGVTYRLQIIAIDPDGNRKTLVIPFRLAPAR